MSLADRAARVRARLTPAGVAALLVTDLANVRWLSGFTGSNGWLVLTPDRLTILTDGRYGDQAAAEMETLGVTGDVLVGNLAGMLDHLGRLTEGVDTLGFDAEHVTVAQHGRFGRATTATLVPAAGLVEAERRRKDDAEIAAMARASAIADQALAEVAPHLLGLTETEVRNRLDARMRELGASGPSYDTIVATGPTNASRPHHEPGDTVIEDGHTVVIDVGALVDGYHSDMTRTFVVGRPTALQRELYDVVLRAQQAGVAAVRAGLSAKELDAVCRGIITDAGYGPWFSHGTGHGVGLVIHEEPFANTSSDALLQVGDVVTVEPGVYHGGFGGIRVEDLVVVTSDGCRVLTNSPKESACLPSPPTT